MSARRARQSGFTLIEVIIAIGILAFLSMLIFSAVSGMHRSREGVARINDRYHEGRAAMTMITRDLQAAYLSLNLPADQQLAVVKTGFRGESQSPADRLDFNTFSNRRYFLNSHHSDQAEISYFASVDPEQSGVTDLVRRISPRPDLEFDKGGRVEVLATDIDLFALEYLDPTTGMWSESWDSTSAIDQSARLPIHVRVALVLNGGRREAAGRSRQPIKFITTVRIQVLGPLRYAGQ